MVGERRNSHHRFVADVPGSTSISSQAGAEEAGFGGKTVLEHVVAPRGPIWPVCQIPPPVAMFALLRKPHPPLRFQPWSSVPSWSPSKSSTVRQRASLAQEL